MSDNINRKLWNAAGALISIDDDGDDDEEALVSQLIEQGAEVD